MSFLCFLGNICAYNGWDERNSTICLKVIILFVLHAQQSPLSSPDSLGVGGEEKHHLEIVEEGIGLPIVVKEQNIDVTQNKIAEDCPIVKHWCKVCLFSKITVFRPTLVLT